MINPNKSRPLIRFLAIAAVVWPSLMWRQSEAGLGLSKFVYHVSRGNDAPLKLDRPVLPPFAHALFCSRLPEECKRKVYSIRYGHFRLTRLRQLQLAEVNAEVNRSIIPIQKTANVLDAKWTIAPSRGDCNDYAVTKRSDLIAMGWPTDALLLAEVVTGWGEHHLVLVVNVPEGRFLLDNLAADIRPASDAPYRWVRMQSPRDPKLWWTVRVNQV